MVSDSFEINLEEEFLRANCKRKEKANPVAGLRLRLELADKIEGYAYLIGSCGIHAVAVTQNYLVDRALSPNPCVVEQGKCAIPLVCQVNDFDLHTPPQTGLHLS